MDCAAALAAFTAGRSFHEATLALSLVEIDPPKKDVRLHTTEIVVNRKCQLFLNFDLSDLLTLQAVCAQPQYYQAKPFELAISTN